MLALPPRRLLGALRVVACVVAVGPLAVAAQSSTVAFGAGAGAMGPGRDLGPDVSVSAERRVPVSSDRFPKVLKRAKWSLGIEVEAHIGFENSADRWLVGAAAVPHVAFGPATKPRVYFVPLAVGVHAGQFDAPLARGLAVRPAYGNGLGLEVPTARGAAWVELRTMRLAFDDGGSLAVRTGYRF